MYGLILTPILVAAILYFYYFIKTDSSETRKLLPSAILMASIAQFVLALWVIIYISCIHSDSVVYEN